MSIFKQVTEIIVEQVHMDMKNIKMESNFIKDLDADSLDVVELAMTIEDEFKIEIEDTIVENFKTVGDVVNYLEKAK